MQINNNNCSQTSFKQRLYLKNIDKKNLDYYKDIAKVFHQNTKDVKGASFSLTDKGDVLELMSNQYKQNFANVDKNTIKKGGGLLLAKFAKLLRPLELKYGSANASKVVTYSFDGVSGKVSETINSIN